MVMCSTCHNVKKSEVENFAIEFKEKILVYYGGADTCIGVASITKDELLNELT